MKCHRASSLFSDRPGLHRGDTLTAPGILTAASSADPTTAAQCYLALGFSVIPLRGKAPRVTWREYQQRRPTRAELQRWVRRELFQNLGIVCGEVSDSLVVLDFDAPEAYETFCLRFPDFAQTYTVATGGGGWHVYLRVDSLPPSLRGQGVELCASGRMVVAPPSVHPNGQPYRVAQPLDILCVPDLSAVTQWVRPCAAPVRSPNRQASTSIPVSSGLVDAIAEYFRSQGYRQKGEWLNGPCIYPELHAHADAKRSFGFNTQTGYGWCFTCQRSMLAREIAEKLNLEDPAPSGGVSPF